MVQHTMFGHEVTPAQRAKIESVGVQHWVATHPRLVARWIAEHEARIAELWVDDVSKWRTADRTGSE